MAQELALTPLPDDVDMCLAEAEELLFARDRITSALADRVGRVHRAGQARQHGHASTRCWLRTSGGMTVGGAGRLLTLGAELPRLPVVREKFATGELAAGVVEAICAAVAGLTDEQATLAEPILVDLASKAGAAEVAKAGRHLRAVLDPDGEERDERADYGRRFLRVRPGKGGGVEGEFYLPREAGARLMALLQAYAKLRAQGDDRPLTVRQADALIALLEQKIVTELLVVVSAESLPTDPETTDPTADPATEDTDPATQDPADPAADDTDPTDPTDDNPYPADPATQDPADPATQDTAAPAADDDVSDHLVDLGDSAPSDYLPDTAGTTDEPSQADDTADHVDDTRDAEGFGEGRDDTGDSAPGEAGADAGAESADDTNAYAPDATGSADDLSRADDAVSGALGDPGAAGGADDPDIPEEFDTAEAEAEADAGAGSADDTAPAPAEADDVSNDLADLSDSALSGHAHHATGNPEAPNETVATGDCDGDAESTDSSTDSPYATSGLRDGESRGCGAGERGTGERGAGEPGAGEPGAGERGTGEPGAGERGTGEPGAGERRPGERRPGECEPRDTVNTATAERDHTANAASPKGDETISTRPAERDETALGKGRDGDRAATQARAPHATRHASACPADGGEHGPTAPSHTAPSHTAPSDTAPSGATASDAQSSQAAPSEAAPSETAPSEAAPSETARPDPPPEDASAPHTHAGPRPAGDYRHGQGTCRCCGEARCSRATQAPGTPGLSGATPGGPGPEQKTPPGRASGTAPGAGRRTPGTAQAAAQGASSGAAPGGAAGTLPGTAQEAAQGAAPSASAGTMPGAILGSALGASAGALLGASLGMAPGTAPGLLPATGQVLPVSSVHRLARTSTLVRIVMNADGQVLDMGRKVRLATPAQRRAIYARYATCWIDGCPLPATMCQIDHADNWSTGGLTDLKLLGPACQFHNRDRYQHPERYTRRNVGEDRWAFTYHRIGSRRPRV
ncbi:DUF222 domain-containing protein [Microbispora hainanensis]|uniref:DUF222 domain-containing protein n=1 Tax=Microbispora hainanensis TaxID=568844 RepID=UPI003243F2C7